MSRKTFGDAVVRVNRKDGKPVGSVIEAKGAKFELPHWPSRIKHVETTPQGVEVLFETGGRRMLDFRHDATIKEAGSAGGHDPRAHGKIRYIVRAFGKWAQGKHSVCVARIRTEHPEVAAGKNVNALCAWLKDQWAGTTKWRGDKDDPKQRAEAEAIRRKAKGSAYARFTHGMPPLPDDALDALVEDVRSLTGLEPLDVLREVLADDTAAAPSDVFTAIFEAEAEASSRVIARSELALRESRDVEENLALWLAAHGDPGKVGDRPHVIAEAAYRIVTGDGPSRPRSELERRVVDALRSRVSNDPWDGEDMRESTRVQHEFYDRPDEDIVEAKPSRPVHKARRVTTFTSTEELIVEAIKLHEAEHGSDPAFRHYVRGCSRNDLLDLIEGHQQEESIDDLFDLIEADADPAQLRDTIMGRAKTA